MNVTRRSVSGKEDHEVHDDAQVLEVRTRVPTKYVLIDTCTGYVGVGQFGKGFHWQKVVEGQVLEDAQLILQSHPTTKKSPIKRITIYQPPPFRREGEWMLIDLRRVVGVREIIAVRVIGRIPVPWCDSLTVLEDADKNQYVFEGSVIFCRPGQEVKPFTEKLEVV